MNNFDSDKAKIAALIDNFKLWSEEHPPLKVGEACQYCGAPLVALWRSDTEPLFVCCVPCEIRENERYA